jgi:DNA-binding CsgD family transcriptional regulator
VARSRSDVGHKPWQVIKAIEGERPIYVLLLLPREREVLRLRAQGRTLAAIGSVIGASSERVRQIGHQAKRKAAAAQARRRGIRQRAPRLTLRGGHRERRMSSSPSVPEATG